LNLAADLADTLVAAGMQVPMKRLMVSAFAAVALLAAATTMLPWRSPATNRASVTAGMMSLQELHAAAGVNKLPIEVFEDQSLVYSATTRH
jgi:hypothetical protein